MSEVSNRASLATLLAVAALYYLSARAGLQLQFQGSQATPVWPPSGVALAALLLVGRRGAAAVFAGAFLANLADFYLKANPGQALLSGDLIRHFAAHADQVAASALIGLGNMLEAVAGWSLIGRFLPTRDIVQNLRSVLVFVAAALTGCLVSSTIGVSSLYAGGFLPSGILQTVWFTWWLGDVAGMLILAPFLVTWARMLRTRPVRWLGVRPAGVLLVVALVAEFTFNNWLGLPHTRVLAYTLIPLLLWIEFGFGSAAGSLGVVLVSTIAVLGTVTGRGPFGGESQNDALLSLQGFVAVISITSALLSAALRERSEALDDVRRSHDELEDRVRDRTRELEAATLQSKAAEAALRISEAKLAVEKDRAEEASRAKSDFLASMSHEIRTPLNGVIGFADLLLGTQLTDDQRRQVRLMKDSGKSLLAILNDILDISKIEAGRFELEPTAMSPAAVADGAASIVQPQAMAKGLSLELELRPDLPAWVTGDPARLRQVLLNLLSNAVKFTERGSIRLIVGRDRGVQPEAIRFAVIDTGVGIPDERRHLLFQDFSQLDRTVHRRFGGTGLGLAISRRLVSAMGGRIGVESIFGKGSTFWFTVNLPEAAAPAAAGLANDMPAGPPARVLVAEDVYVNQLIVEGTLTAAGHHVELVQNGQEAVAAVQARPFDLVLMDMEMPEMDGISATEAIRRLPGPVSRIPIVALSANAMEEQIQACRAAGMDDHLSKPIDRDRLLSVIDRWRTRARPSD